MKSRLTLKNKIGWFIITMTVFGALATYVGGIRDNYSDHDAKVSSERPNQSPEDHVKYCDGPWDISYHLSFFEAFVTTILGIAASTGTIGGMVWLLEPEKVVIPKATLAEKCYLGATCKDPVE